MKYLVIFLALFMLAIASPVYADGGGEDDNTDCQGQGNPNSPCDPDDDGGNGGGPGGGNGGSGGDGGNGGDGGSGVGVGVGIGGGADVDVENDNTAVGVGIGGDSNATGGDADADAQAIALAEGGDADGGNAEASIEEGAIVVEVEGDEIVYEAAENVVSSVATSFSSICSSGGAGQGRNFALSLAVTNDVCQCLMMADAYMAIGDREEARNWVKAAGRHAKAKGAMGYIRHIATLGIL